ncbi:conserved hypothetical protein [Paecilomyces variotii No. 5]|uniref:Uncharacterized protein n=1 Tax=Byssochlamys spectabilis (strain No. 5 / NBRC 109023) TaxID=1356009 RepID=V5G7A4_BYSSN|nr:conserved hypothetical protein [Paecilomyces variotii No. 5]
MSTSGTNSPFRIRGADLRELERNEEFTALRQLLERIERETDALSFCPFHQQSCSAEEQSSFRLHRDILHAIFAPLFKIHKYTTQVASHVLQDRKSADTELAFRGDARSAYSWLNCFLAEEHDWCSTQGCPACVVLYVLDSEPTIRITAVACLLSNYIQETIIPDTKRRLPSFDFWMGALETAVREDQFWGDAFWPEIEYRAWALENGIKQLISQSLELRDHKEVQKDRLRSGCTTSSFQHGSTTIEDDQRGTRVDIEDGRLVLAVTVPKRPETEAARARYAFHASNVSQNSIIDVLKSARNNETIKQQQLI